MWPQCQSQLAHILCLSLCKSLQNWMCDRNQDTFQQRLLHMTEPEKNEKHYLQETKRVFHHSSLDFYYFIFNHTIFNSEFEVDC